MLTKGGSEANDVIHNAGLDAYMRMRVVFDVTWRCVLVDA